MKNTTLLLVVSCLLLSCPSPEPAKVGYPEGCTGACRRLGELLCPEGQPTEAGATCEDVCLSVETSGIATLKTECVAAAQTCEAVRNCFLGETNERKYSE